MKKIYVITILVLGFLIACGKEMKNLLQTLLKPLKLLKNTNRIVFNQPYKCIKTSFKVSGGETKKKILRRLNQTLHLAIY